MDSILYLWDVRFSKDWENPFAPLHEKNCVIIYKMAVDSILYLLDTMLDSRRIEKSFAIYGALDARKIL